MALTVTSLEILPHQSVSNALDCRAGKIVRMACRMTGRQRR